MKQVLLGDILISEGLIDANALKSGLEEQKRKGGKLGALLLDLGFLSQRDLLRVLSSQLDIPFILSNDFPKIPPDLELNLQVKFLKRYKILPLARLNGTLKVATANPQDPYPFEALELATGLKAELFIGSEKEIAAMLEDYYGDGAATVDTIVEGIGEKGDEALQNIDDVEQLKDMAQEAPIINLVNLLISKAMDKRSSDIHIEPFGEVLHVRYRIDGILYLIETLPKRLHLAVASRIKIMSKLNIAERRLPQDGRIKSRWNNKDIDIRVSTIPTLYGESIVMRLLDPTGMISLEAIGFSEANRNTFTSLIRQPHGMILVTGPTGSGKSTTLYAALSKIDTIEKKVITIEDPVEYNFNGVNQIQVKPKIGLTFAGGLRSIVRQDPDVIMVGEIRDGETADIAIHSALTGHLILSTLHTNDAPGAVTRLIDMGVESYLISSSLLAVVAQRLVRVICEECKCPDSLEGASYQNYREELERIRSKENLEYKISRGKGCERCANTGYRGRTSIFEMMTVTEEIRQLIVEKKGSNIIRQQAIREGMVPLREDGMVKVIGGVTTLDEVIRVTLEQ
ncbi:MAG: GspE/PulE family protein [Nitrospiria bacterium]